MESDKRTKNLFETLLNSSGVEEQFEKIIEDCKRKKTKYKDPEFYPQKSIIEEDKEILKEHIWRRIEEQYPNNLFTNISPESIQQGSLGDCYLVASFIYASQHPNLVKNLFHPKSSLEYGCVLVYFYFLGERIPVIIDTQIAYRDDSSSIPLFCTPRTKNDSCWFVLIEKAFAKACGGYSSIKSGTTHCSVRLLFDYFASAYNNVADIIPTKMIQNEENFDANEKIFEILQKMTKNKAMIGTSISDESSNKNTELLGLISKHAYYVIDVRQSNKMYFIKLRNPWGIGQYKGNYSKGSAKWTEQLRKDLDYDEKEDGSFWMQLENYLYYFDSICFSLPKEKNWKEMSVYGKIDGYLDGRSPCSDSANVGCIPQWSIKFTQKTVVRLSFDAASPVSYFGIYIVKNHGIKVDSITKGTEIERSTANTTVNGIEYYIDDFSEPYTFFFNRENKMNEPCYFRILIQSPDKNFTVKKFDDDFIKEKWNCESGSYYFSNTDMDQWDPTGLMPLTTCRQWFINFPKLKENEETKIRFRIFKNISEGPLFLFFARTDKRLSYSYKKLLSYHFTIHSNSEYEEYSIPISNKDYHENNDNKFNYVFTIYRNKQNDINKFKFFVLSKSEFVFGLMKEPEPAKNCCYSINEQLFHDDKDGASPYENSNSFLALDCMKQWCLKFDKSPVTLFVEFIGTNISSDHHVYLEIREKEGQKIDLFRVNTIHFDFHIKKGCNHDQAIWEIEDISSPYSLCVTRDRSDSISGYSLNIFGTEKFDCFEINESGNLGEKADGFTKKRDFYYYAKERKFIVFPEVEFVEQPTDFSPKNLKQNIESANLEKEKINNQFLNNSILKNLNIPQGKNQDENRKTIIKHLSQNNVLNDEDEDEKTKGDSIIAKSNDEKENNSNKNDDNISIDISIDIDSNKKEKRKGNKKHNKKSHKNKGKSKSSDDEKKHKKHNKNRKNKNKSKSDEKHHKNNKDDSNQQTKDTSEKSNDTKEEENDQSKIENDQSKIENETNLSLNVTDIIIPNSIKNKLNAPKKIFKYLHHLSMPFTCITKIFKTLDNDPNCDYFFILSEYELVILKKEMNRVSKNFKECLINLSSISVAINNTIIIQFKSNSYSSLNKIEFTTENPKKLIDSFYDHIQRLLASFELQRINFFNLQTPKSLFKTTSQSISARLNSLLKLNKIEIQDDFIQKVLATLYSQSNSFVFQKVKARKQIFPILFNSILLSKIINSIEIKKAKKIYPLILDNIEYFDNILHIKIEGPASKELFKLIEKSKKIKSLSFVDFQIEDFYYVTLLMRKNRIHSVGFDSSITEKTLSKFILSKSFNNLKYFRVSNLKSIDFDSCVDRFMNLSVLSLKSCNLSLGNVFETMMLYEFSFLKEIDLSGNFGNGFSKKEITFSDKLIKLFVNNVQWEIDSLIFFMNSCSNSNLSCLSMNKISFLNPNSKSNSNKKDKPFKIKQSVQNDFDDFSNKCWNSFFSSLPKKMNSISSLNWDSNKIDSKFATFLLKSDNLKYVSFSSCDINDISSIRKLLVKSKIQSAVIRKIKYDDLKQFFNHFKDFLSHMSHMKSLKQIDLGKNKFNNDCFDVLSESLINLESIECITIDDSNSDSFLDFIKFYEKLKKSKIDPIKISYPIHDIQKLELNQNEIDRLNRYLFQLTKPLSDRKKFNFFTFPDFHFLRLQKKFPEFLPSELLFEREKFIEKQKKPNFLLNPDIFYMNGSSEETDHYSETTEKSNSKNLPDENKEKESKTSDKDKPTEEEEEINQVVIDQTEEETKNEEIEEKPNHEYVIEQKEKPKEKEEQKPKENPKEEQKQIEEPKTKEEPKIDNINYYSYSYSYSDNPYYSYSQYSNDDQNGNFDFTGSDSEKELTLTMSTNRKKRLIYVDRKTIISKVDVNKRKKLDSMNQKRKQPKD